MDTNEMKTLLTMAEPHVPSSQIRGDTSHAEHVLTLAHQHVYGSLSES